MKLETVKRLLLEGNISPKHTIEFINELEKDRDEYRERYTCNQHTVLNQSARIKELSNGLLIIKDWLNPEPFSDVEAALSHINFLLTPHTEAKEEGYGCGECSDPEGCKRYRTCYKESA